MTTAKNLETSQTGVFTNFPLAKKPSNKGKRRGASEAAIKLKHARYREKNKEVLAQKSRIHLACYRENLQMREAYKARAQIAQETFRKKHSVALAFRQHLRCEDIFCQTHGNVRTRQRRKVLDNGVDYEEEYKTTKLSGAVWLATSQSCRAPGPGAYVSCSKPFFFRDSCKHAAEGITGGNGGSKKYSTYAECLPVWHARCEAGDHGHGLSALGSSTSESDTDGDEPPPLVSPSKRRKSPGTPQRRGGFQRVKGISLGHSIPLNVSSPTIWILDDLPEFIRPVPATTATAATVAAPTLLPIPTPIEYFAVQGSHLVDTCLPSSVQRFEADVLHRGDAQLCSTGDLEVALLYAEGHDYFEAVRLSVERRQKRTDTHQPRYFAIHGGHVVLSGAERAVEALADAVRREGQAIMCTTSDVRVAMFFSQGKHLADAHALALELEVVGDMETLGSTLSSVSLDSLTPVTD
ncbi:hypothetical protein C8J57DRAFT_1220398 [Mycena rebaudengoi]|nr:hypothetical protein C8J57DRAFT_1220398 [Mycena rebaudengoi]